MIGETPQGSGKSDKIKLRVTDRHDSFTQVLWVKVVRFIRSQVETVFKLILNGEGGKVLNTVVDYFFRIYSNVHQYCQIIQKFSHHI